MGRRFLILALVTLSAAACAGAWFWFYGPCGISRVAESRAALRREADERWSDALNIAARTPAIALSGPVSKLQDLRRETKELVLSPCADDARELLMKSMGYTIAAFLAFMSATPAERSNQTQQQQLATHAAEELEFFRDELGRLEHCAPTCSRGAVDWRIKRESRENVRRDAAQKVQQEQAADRAAAQAKAEAAASKSAAATAARLRPGQTVVARDVPGPAGTVHLEVLTNGVKVGEGTFVGCWDLDNVTANNTTLTLWANPKKVIISIDKDFAQEAQAIVKEAQSACTAWHERAWHDRTP